MKKENVVITFVVIALVVSLVTSLTFEFGIIGQLVHKIGVFYAPVILIILGVCFSGVITTLPHKLNTIKIHFFNFVIKKLHIKKVPHVATA